MSPKKEEGGEAPHAPFLCHGWCLYCGHMQAQGRLFELQPPPPPPAPLCTLFGIAFPFLLNRIAVLFTMKPGHLIHQMENLLGCPWTWFGDDQGKKKKEKEKKPHVYCLWVSLPLWQSPLQSISTKAFCSTWRDERRTSPFTLESHDTHTALLWNTTSAVPCSGVCSSSGVLRRPICLADHCLFDVAANVTFLFQSKTQQGVPSVWHSLHSSSPMPFCADHFTWQFAQIFYTLILVNISACFFLNNMSLRWVSSVIKKKDKKAEWRHR